jgi:hypothetical protein
MVGQFLGNLKRVVRLTDSCDYDDVAVFTFSHDRQDGFDNVDIGEEVNLKDLIHQTYGAITLSQLFDSADHSYDGVNITLQRIMNQWVLPSLAAHRSTSIRPKASTASATAA